MWEISYVDKLLENLAKYAVIGVWAIVIMIVVPLLIPFATLGWILMRSKFVKTFFERLESKGIL